MAEKRSPLKDKPLRNPGQSADEAIDDFMYDKVLAPLFMAIFLIVLALAEWTRAWLATPPSPWLYTFIAGAGVIYACFRIWRVKPVVKAMRQGRDGERAVGQYLERLREQGFQVLHEIVGENFNVDHVLIGPCGVYTIETKTYSKRPDGKLYFDGEAIRADGYQLDAAPVVQARAQASWLRSLLTESTGRTVPVRPVVVFPGWFIEAEKGALKDTWVLNPKALPHFLAREPRTLSPEDVRLLTYHLSRFVRTHPAANAQLST